MKFLDRDHPFFRSALSRWLTTLLPLAWGLFEIFYVNSPGWGVVFVGAGAWAGYEFFIRK